MTLVDNKNFFLMQTHYDATKLFDYCCNNCMEEALKRKENVWKRY